MKNEDNRKNISIEDIDNISKLSKVYASAFKENKKQILVLFPFCSEVVSYDKTSYFEFKCQNANIELKTIGKQNGSVSVLIPVISFNRALNVSGLKTALKNNWQKLTKIIIKKQSRNEYTILEISEGEYEL